MCRYDLEDAFGKYGPVKNVWVARRPPGFGFVEMEARQDAEDGVGKVILLINFGTVHNVHYTSLFLGEVAGWDQGGRSKD